MNTTAILTEAPKQIETGKQLVEYHRKSTSKNPVPEADKYRAAIVPAFPTFAVVNKVDDTDAEPQQVFRDAVSEVVNKAAGDILRDFIAGNKDAKEIDLSLLEFSAVVSRMAANQTSDKMNGKMIGDWYDSSTMPAEAAERYSNDASKVAKLRQAFCSLASNNSGLAPTLALKMLTYMERQDLANPVAKAISMRLDRISKQDTSDDL